MNSKIAGLSPELVEKLKADIIKIIGRNYYELSKPVRVPVSKNSPYYKEYTVKEIGTGDYINGDSVSSVLSRLRDYPLNWKGIGTNYNLEEISKKLGFGVDSAKNNRGNKGTVIYIKDSITQIKPANFK